MVLTVLAWAGAVWSAPAAPALDPSGLPLVTEALTNRIRVLFIEGRGKLHGYPDVDFLERNSDLRFIYQGRPDAEESDTAAVTDGQLWDNAQAPLIAAERQALLRRMLDRRAFELIVLQARSLPADIQNTLIAYVREGGVLVWLGQDLPPAGVDGATPSPDPIWQLCPWLRNAKPGKFVLGDRAYTETPLHALTCGIPFERMLLSRRQQPTCQLRPEGQLLVRWQKAGHPVLGVLPVGRGEVIGFGLPMTAPSMEPGDVDSDFLWARFWEQIGRYARDDRRRDRFQARVVASDSIPMAGGVLTTRVTVVSREAAEGAVELDLALTDASGRTATASRQPAAVGGDTTVMLQLPDALPTGTYRLDAALRTGRRTLHRGFAFVDISGRADAALTSDKPGYAIGETARFAASITTAVDRAVTLHFTVRDAMDVPVFHAQKTRTGRAGQELRETFDWPMPDYGIEGWVFRADLQVAGEGCFAAATHTFWRYQPWTFREKLLLNSWWEPPLTPMLARHHRAIGLNATFRGEPDSSRFNLRNWNLKGATRMEIYTDHFRRSDFTYLSNPTNQSRLTERDRAARSAATILHDFGEETGWYYKWSHNAFKQWSNDAEIPDGAHTLFRSYLLEKYGTLAKLNGAWETNFTALTEARLSRRFGFPTGWLFDKPPADVPENIAPYIDTHGFFYWYVRRTAESFTAGVNALNPTPSWGMSFSLTFNLFSPVPMTMCHPDYHASALLPWNHQARARSRGGDTPLFSFHWGFDEEATSWGQFWNQSMAFNATLITSWGSLFNYDFTHSRPTLQLKRLMARVRPREAFFLNLHLPDDYDVGFFHPDLDWQQVHSRPNFYLRAQGAESAVMGQLGYKPTGTSWLGGPEFQIFNAIVASGYSPRYVTEDEIPRCRVLVVPYVETMPATAAQRMAAFVEQGGTLITMPVLATHDGHGTPYRGALPGGGLDRVLGLTLATPLVGQRSLVTLPSQDPRLPMRFSPRIGSEPAYLWTYAYQRMPSLATNTHVIARNIDGVPLLTMHPYGKGRSLHLNAVTFGNFDVYETAPFQTESLRQLFDNLIRSAGVHPPLFVEDPRHYGVGIADWAQYQYRLADSEVRVLALFSDRTSPRTAAEVVLSGEPAAVYDILNGNPVPLRYRQGEASVEETDPFAFTKSTKAGARSGYTFPVELEPGDVAFFAILPRPAAALGLELASARIVAGQAPLDIVLRRRGADGRLETAGWPVEVTVMDANGMRLPMLSRRLAARGETELTVPTRLGDPGGRWTVRAVDCVTGARIERTIDVTASPLAASVPAVNRFPFPSDQSRAIELSDEEFIQLVDALQSLYRTGGLQSKGSLSYYCQEYDSSRHRILQLLHQTDWRQRVKPLKAYVAAGRTLILAGEDLGFDPATGLALDLASQPQDDSMDMATGGALPEGLMRPHVLEALEAVCDQPIRERLQSEPFAETGMVIPVRRGRIVIDTTSLDNAGQQNGQFRANHAAWLRRLQAIPGVRGAPVQP